MEKVSYNLLTTQTTAPISISSTDSIEGFGPIVALDNAINGILYFDVRGFSTDTAGVLSADFQLYQSHMGDATGDWWVHTAVPTISSATHSVLNLSYLGNYVRLGYNIGTDVSLVRFYLEVFNEYDIDSLGHY